MIFEGNCAEQCFSMAQSGYVVRFETPGARATLAPREEMLGESQRTWVQLWQPLPASRVVPPLSLIVQHRCDSFIRAMGATLEALIAAFCRLDKSLSCCWEKGWLVGAVGIELEATLKARKLLIPLNAENAKKSEFAQMRYTAGTRELEMVEGRSRIGFKEHWHPSRDECRDSHPSRKIKWLAV
jgi:hypothetical protein